MTNRVAYFGPAGTFTEAAALAYDPNAELIPFPSISAVLSAVESQLADEGVVPIENSLEGSVTETLDLLIHESTLTIYRELAIPIDHCLIVSPSMSLGDVEVIYSHPYPKLGLYIKLLQPTSDHLSPISYSSSCRRHPLLQDEEG